MRITEILAGLEKDAQVADVQKKLAAEAEKKATEKKAGEKGAIAGPANPEDEIGAQMGDTEMDARAKLHSRAMIAAGKQREMQTWRDGAEMLNARNPGTAPAAAAPSGLDNQRHVRPTGQSLPSAGGKMASEKPLTIKRASLAEWAELVSQKDGEKLAAEKLSSIDQFDLALQADTYRFMGACNAIGEMREMLTK